MKQRSLCFIAAILSFSVDPDESVNLRSLAPATSRTAVLIFRTLQQKR
jgi:hypothetical protein